MRRRLAMWERMEKLYPDSEFFLLLMVGFHLCCHVRLLFSDIL